MDTAGEEPLESARRRGFESPNFFIVSTGTRYWYVSVVTARYIEDDLDRRRVPEWITFVDLSGSRIRLRAAEIRMIVESRSEQRAFDRALERRIDTEASQDPDT